MTCYYVEKPLDGSRKFGRSVESFFRKIMNFLEGSRKSGKTLESSNSKLVSDKPITLRSLRRILESSRGQ